MFKGSCLCGDVKFHITGDPFSLSYCHCSRCRKAAGIYSAVLIGKAEDLEITEGQDSIVEYASSSEWKHGRKFCKSCGTSLGDLVSGNVYVVAASAVDSDLPIQPMAHIHTLSKPNWYEINDNLKKFEGDYVPET